MTNKLLLFSVVCACNLCYQLATRLRGHAKWYIILLAV